MNTTTMYMRIALLLAFWFPALGLQAISVDVVMTSADYCIDDFAHAQTGALEAMVTGGTPPYRFDWYDITDGAPLELCTDCGSTLSGLVGLRTYKVVVTDALSATAEDSEGIQGIAGPQFTAYTLAYEAGTPPVLIGEIVNEMTWNDPNSIVEVVAMSPAPIAEYGPWPGLYSLYKAMLPIGTAGGTITLSATDGVGTCQNEFTFTIDPPTVIPDIELLAVEGSCSTIGTGTATVRFSNGDIPSGMNIILVDQVGYSMGMLSVGVQPEVRTFDHLLPGNYWLVLSGDLAAGPVEHIPGFTYTCKDSIPFIIPDLGPTCGVVSGTLFLDNNLDCVKQTSERGIPSTVLEVLPGPYYATTDQSGVYSLVLPLGDYTVREQSAVVEEHCTQALIPFTISSGSTATVNHPTESLVPLDVRVSLASGPARPGFELQYAVNVRNLTVSNTGTVTVTMQLDPALGFVSASPAPGSVSGQVLTWNLPAMPVFQQRSIIVRTQVPPDIGLIGTDLIASATVSTALTDGDLTNNAATDIRTVTGSYDPNDKLARTSSGNAVHYDPEVDDWIDYTIRFQNTGTDTAFHVWITDTLELGLDASSFRIGAASHAFSWEVDGQGVLTVKFPYIFLPDSTVNEPRSHGFVSFRIHPRSGYLELPGDNVSNTANIYFDFNPPVITPPSVLSVAFPGLLVSPRMLLGGVEGAGSGTMVDALRAQSLIPAQEPYTALGYAHLNGGGGETVQPSVLSTTGTDAIVDWVVVELRSAIDPAIRLATRSALLQRDGDVVDLDGTSAVTFPVLAGNYRVGVRHRNHLGVMTANSIALSSTTTVVDLTSAATVVYGTNARVDISGRLCLWPGDVNFDGTAKYTGMQNDRDLILQGVGGSTPTNTITTVYDANDINLDGTIMYTGNDNDRDIILQTIGGTVPTAVRVQQLP